MIRNNKNLKDGSLVLMACENFRAKNVTFIENYSVTEKAGFFAMKSS